MASRQEHVVACARFRPRLPFEQDVASPWKLLPNAVTTLTDAENYPYDMVLAQDVNNYGLYDALVEPIVSQFFNGINGTIFAYGQTASGKTHTIFGELDDPGIVLQVIDAVFAFIHRHQRKQRLKVAISYFEVYNETVLDLLDPVNSGSLAVREATGQFYVEGLAVRLPSTLDEAMQLVEYGNSNKTMGQSHLNERSSRSHTVFRVTLASERRARRGNSGFEGESADTNLKLSELNLVDLAGAEALTYEFGAGQQAETKAINLSLFSLRNVIIALANRESYVPYRNSLLTRILQTALNGNSKTAIICNLSPAFEHQTLTKASLRFGNISRTIQIKATANTFCKEGLRLKLKAQGDEETLKIDPSRKPRHRTAAQSVGAGQLLDLPVTTTTFATRQGPIHAYVCSPLSPPTTSGSTILALHAFGGGCDGRDWESLFLPLASAGFRVVAPDFPGFGRTPGRRHTSRSERFADAGGPLEVVIDILNAIGATPQCKVGLLGWDWGGGLALSTGLSAHKTKVSAIGVYHPSWTDKPELLGAIKQQTLMCWVPVDQLHNYNLGKKLARIIPRSKLVSLTCSKRNADLAQGKTSVIWEEMSRIFVEFFLAQQPKSAPPQARPETSAESSDSDEEIDDDDEDDDDCISRDSSFMAHMLTDPLLRLVGGEDRLSKPAPRRQPTAPTVQTVSPNPPPNAVGDLPTIKWAVQRWADILRCGEAANYYDAILGRNGQTALRPAASQLFGRLPVITCETKLREFMDWGIWPVLPTNAEAIPQFPRYPIGRRVMVRARVQYRMTRERFGYFDPRSSDQGLTYRGVVVGGTRTHCIVALPTVTETEKHRLSVPWKDVYDWNEPTNFKVDAARGRLLFEDGIALRYTDLVTRAKLVEAALSISNVVAQMDFSRLPTDRALVLQQLQCLANLRGVLDIIHHVNEGKDPNRLCVPDAGRLAVHGQWHCHGMASVQAAFLVPFGRFLGIEVRFRDGFWCSRTREEGWDGKPRQSADHTWLEATLVPSMLSFVTDASFRELCLPYSFAYSADGSRFPTRELQSANPIQPPRFGLDPATEVATDAGLESWPVVEYQWSGPLPTAVDWIRLLQGWSQGFPDTPAISVAQVPQAAATERPATESRLAVLDPFNRDNSDGWFLEIGERVGFCTATIAITAGIAAALAATCKRAGV